MAQQFAEDALTKQKEFYDSRYKDGYMEGMDYDVYEQCRVRTVHEISGDLAHAGFNPAAILDYGCGQGRYVGELKKLFPQAKLSGCDISDIGLAIAKKNFPYADFRAMASESAPWPDASFDFLISIEVLEHVADVHRATREIGRLLKPGGMALITTPCANRYSFEWLAQKMSGGLQPSHDGFGRFSSDEPGHLRRLNDGHMRTLLGTAGVQAQRFYHRTHFFGSVAEMPLVRRLPQRVRAKIAMMDWHLFKHLPNGATMLVVAKK